MCAIYIILDLRTPTYEVFPQYGFAYAQSSCVSGMWNGRRRRMCMASASHGQSESRDKQKLKLFLNKETKK